MENKIDASSNDFDEYIKTNINYVISETWSLQNTREEIFRSRKLLKTLKDYLFPNNYKYFGFGNLKFIFDVIIEDFARWTIKKEILNVLDKCLNNMTETEIHGVSHNLLSRKTYNLYYLYKLIDLLSVYGDYDFQVLLIQIIFRTFEKHNYSIIDLLPESEDLQNKFLEITMENFEGSVRTFLNGINKRSQNIFSIKCRNIRLGSIECVGINSGLWIDFNLIDKIASWYTNIEVLLSEKDREIHNKFCNLILLFQRDVEVVTIKRNLCKTIVVTFTLQKSCVSYYEKYQHLIDDAKTIHILLDYSPEAEYLIRSILPDLYKNKFMHKFNKRRKLSLNMNPYIKIPTRTSSNCEMINLSSSSNSISDIHSISETFIYKENQIRQNILKHRDLNIQIPSHDSEIHIKSKKDLLNSEETNERDLDDMNVYFESEEQLLTLAREFDAIKSVLNSDVLSIDNNKNSVDIGHIKPRTPSINSIKSNVFQIFCKNEFATIKVPAATKMDRAKKRKRHVSVKSTENIEIPSNCDFSISKYFSDQKIKSKRSLKPNVNKNETSVSNYKFNKKISRKNHTICFQFHNKLLREKLGEIKNIYKPTNTKQESFNTDHYDLNFSDKSEISIQQCRAADEEIGSDLSISLFGDMGIAKHTVESSIEDEMYAISEMKNNLNPYVEITAIPLAINAVTNSLEDKVESDYDIISTKNVIDKPKEKSVDVPHCSGLKTKHLGENLSSTNVSVWSKSAFLGNTKITLCSKDFVGKYLLIICYNINNSINEPTLYSEITRLNEKIEDFNKIGASILICLKGPNINFSEWINLENQKFLRNLNVPLIFDFDGNFMSTNFRVYLKNVESEIKILILVNDRGDVIYKNIYSIFDEVDVDNSLKLLRHVQMLCMMT